MTDSSNARQLLARAISGQHVGRLEEVKVTKQSGEGVVITPLVGGKPQPKASQMAPEDHKGAVALDDAKVSDRAAVDPKQVAMEASEQKADTSSRRQAARGLFDKGAFKSLQDMKKKTKLSWSALGFNIREIEQIEAALKTPAPAPQPAPVAQVAPPAPEPKVEAAKPVVTPSKPASNTRQLKALELLNRTRNQDLKPSERQGAAVELVALKKTSKVSWDALGINEPSSKSVIGLATGPAAIDPSPIKTVVSKPKVTKPVPANAVTVSDTKAEAPKAPVALQGGRQDKAQELYRKGDLEALKLLKKQSKVSWAALGFEAQAIEAIEAGVPIVPPTPHPAEPTPAPKTEAMKKTAPTNQGTTKMEGTRAEVARKLFNNAINDRTQWGLLWLHKQKSKLGWDALGFSKEEIRRIQNSKPAHI